MTEFPEPRGGADVGELFPRYLDFFRETVIRKVRALTPVQLRESLLPSGWTPIELVQHLAFMEQRWMVWGFLGEQVEQPWGDARDDRWHVAEDRTLDEVVEMLRAVGERTTAALSGHPLDEIAPEGPRFEREPASLAWIAFHVLQEYARHTGHLDVAVELAGGEVGE